ncbi:uncharacterized protein LOC123470648 [Daphnia magna]|uniref:uncharacterized protein LOC123470648 n=1 Tax=Daphnia magna TaxID=35525 RepID=UPI001E1BB080|nr:uncharacterized protein LOC123470648 [Daphnia magna]
MAALAVNHRATTPYHPQSNGLVERLNHTLADMLSMEAILPIDVMMNGNPNPVKHDGQDEVVKKLGEAQQVVAQWLHRVQEKQKDAYDAGRRVATDFKVGDEVLVYKPFRKIGWSEKLLHRWRGPYVVVRETSSLNYEVKLPRARKSEIVHVVSMKKFARGSPEVTDRPNEENFLGDTLPVTPPLEGVNGQ